MFSPNICSHTKLQYETSIANGLLFHRHVYTKFDNVHVATAVNSFSSGVASGKTSEFVSPFYACCNLKQLVAFLVQ